MGEELFSLLKVLCSIWKREWEWQAGGKVGNNHGCKQGAGAWALIVLHTVPGWLRAGVTALYRRCECTYIECPVR